MVSWKISVEIGNLFVAAYEQTLAYQEERAGPEGNLTHYTKKKIVHTIMFL